MTVLETTFTIELNEKDVDLITTALHREYKVLSELNEQERDQDDLYGKYYKDMNAARDLRNKFAGLLNKQYMGIDA